METMEYKAFQSKAAIENADQGLVHAVVSCYGNADHEKDIVEKGAFRSTIDAAEKGTRPLPPGVFSHNWEQPVAKTDRMWEEDDGLHVLGRFNLETQIGRETFSNIKCGIIQQYSFGYTTLQAERKGDNRHIQDVRMYEWSPVLWGMNELTHTVGAKGLLTGLKAADFDTHSEAVLTAVREYAERAQLLAKRRQRDGREISDERVAAWKDLRDALTALLVEAARPDAEKLIATRRDLLAASLEVDDLLAAIGG